MNRFQRIVQAVYGVAQGVGELLVQQEEFNDPVGTEVGRIHLAKGFECGTGAQQADPFKVLGCLGRFIRRPQNSL